MSFLRRLYGDSLSLLTDLYQLTMAYGYWKEGLLEREAAFHLFFRKHPFGGEYAIACGLETAVEYLRTFRFEPEDLEYLATLEGNDGRRLFEPAFLDYLDELKLTCDVDAIPEGTAVFAQEPLVRVTGPILQCQLLETPLLNLVNFPTLIATKAARVCQAAEGGAVIEFGLRRSQGIDGGATVGRASYVGGCAGTSNVLAGKLFGIPVKGTHAHSWIMCFDDEREAFRAYADAMPNNCIFLVDTYDTVEGVRNAVRTAQRLRENGHEMVGIRLDSGDLTELSIAAREMLDAGGFPEAKIVASSDLDEFRIQEMQSRGCRVDLWGVGTSLATAKDDPALGGVYKLAAVRDPGQEWQHRIKVSDSQVKTTNPGVHQVRRFTEDGRFVADVIYDEACAPPEGEPWSMVRLGEDEVWRTFDTGAEAEDLLVPVFRKGELVYESPPLDATRDRTAAQLGSLPEGVRRLSDADAYPVGLEAGLQDLKRRMIREKQEDEPTGE